MGASTQPGDLIEIVRRLRRLISAYDNAQYVIHGSFQTIDPTLEVLAQQLRPAVDDTASLICGFLERIEALPAYVEQRTVRLEERR